MTHLNEAEEHDFTAPDGKSLGNQSLTLGAGHYAELLSNPQYKAKKEADKISYAWDELIEIFTRHMISGTTLIPDGSVFNLHEQEEPVRYMAQVPRHVRRIYAAGILDLLEMNQSHPRATRAFLPHPKSEDHSTSFFFLALKVPEFELEGGYEQYRNARRAMLEIYALSFLHKHPNLERIIGIASEPPGSGGGSEDLILVEQPEWDDELLDRLKEGQMGAGIMKEGIYDEYHIHSEEYPILESDKFAVPQHGKIVRKKKKIGRNEKCPCGSDRKYKHCCLKLL